MLPPEALAAAEAACERGRALLIMFSREDADWRQLEAVGVLFGPDNNTSMLVATLTALAELLAQVHWLDNRVHARCAIKEVLMALKHINLAS
jgi:hypothetical protein